MAPQIPHAPKVEQRILACCMVDADSQHECMSALTADDFWAEKHRRCFELFRRLSASPGALQDPSIVRQACTADRELLELLEELLRDTSWIGVDVSAACGYLRDLTTARALREAAIRVVSTASESVSDPVGYLDSVSDTLVAAIQGRRTATKVQTLNDVLYEIGMELQDSETSDQHVATGFRCLDETLGGGWERGRLYIPAGRPAMGKTAFVMQSVLAAVFAGKRAAVFSLEMPQLALSKRLVASRSRVNSRAIRRGQLTPHAREKVLRAAEDLANLPLVFPEANGIKLDEIVRVCRQLKLNGGLDIVAIDYLQLIEADTARRGDSREQEVSRISRTLKRMARQLNVPVLALSQLSRKVEERPDKRPMMSDLRESGAIEQDADVILFLFRPDYYEPDQNKHTGQCQVIVAKNRDGDTGFVTLDFEKEYTRFSESGQEMYQ